MFRGFIAVDIEPTTEIIDLENKLKKTGANIKLVSPENIHITLKFLGDTKEKMVDEIEQIIQKSVDDIKPFDIKLKGLGVFPKPTYIKVIWIGIKQAELLSKIAEKINQGTSQLGFKKDKRGFSPHLTIARMRSAKNKQQLLELIQKYNDLLFSKQRVDTVILKKSELTSKGPIYSDLKKVKL